MDACAPAAEARSASMEVAISPSTTATRNFSARRGSVCSMRDVLPAPGEAIRLIEKTPAASRRVRFCSANRSLALKIFSTTGMRSVIYLFNLNSIKIELFPGNDFHPCTSTIRTYQFGISKIIFMGTVQTFELSGYTLEVQPGTFCQSFLGDDIPIELD